MFAVKQASYMQICLIDNKGVQKTMNIITVKNPYETKETNGVKGKVIRKA